MIHPLRRALLPFILLLLSACGGGQGSSEAFSTETTSSGSLLTRINASDEDQWVYVDLDDTEAFISSSNDPGWDLGFKRQLIQLNNDGLVAIAILDDTSFAQVDGSPTADKFFNDASKEEDDLAFSQERGWYSYNLLKHKLSPRQPRTYVVRSTEGTLFKLSFQGYYDDEDNGGYPSFEWARVDGKKIITGEQKTPCSDTAQEETIAAAVGNFSTSSQGTLTVQEDDQGVVTASLDASLGGPEQAARSSYLYIDLARAEILELSDQDARQNTTWHIAVKRSELRSNSADSGPGRILVSAQPMPLEALSASLIPPQDDPSWQSDDFVDQYCDVKTFGLDFIETAFGQWYEYDFENHVARVKPDQTYLIQDRASQTTWAFSIDAFDAGQFTLRWKAL